MLTAAAGTPKFDRLPDANWLKHRVYAHGANKLSSFSCSYDKENGCNNFVLDKKAVAER